MEHQYSLGFATRAPQGHLRNRWSGTVARSVDQKKMAPATFSKSRGRATGLCERSPTACRPPLQRVKVIDMHQGTRTLPQTHRTPPWCQQRVSVGWPFGGVFMLSERTPVHPSDEGVGMT